VGLSLWIVPKDRFLRKGLSLGGDVFREKASLPLGTRFSRLKKQSPFLRGVKTYPGNNRDCLSLKKKGQKENFSHVTGKTQPVQGEKSSWKCTSANRPVFRTGGGAVFDALWVGKRTPSHGKKNFLREVFLGGSWQTATRAGRGSRHREKEKRRNNGLRDRTRGAGTGYWQGRQGKNVPPGEKSRMAERSLRLVAGKRRGKVYRGPSNLFGALRCTAAKRPDRKKSHKNRYWLNDVQSG